MHIAFILYYIEKKGRLRAKGCNWPPPGAGAGFHVSRRGLPAELRALLRTMPGRYGRRMNNGFLKKKRVIPKTVKSCW
jgi:hypothetical protein